MGMPSLRQRPRWSRALFSWRKFNQCQPPSQYELLPASVEKHLLHLLPLSRPSHLSHRTCNTFWCRQCSSKCFSCSSSYRCSSSSRWWRFSGRLSLSWAGPVLHVPSPSRLLRPHLRRPHRLFHYCIPSPKRERKTWRGWKTKAMANCSRLWVTLILLSPHYN